jgi:hypothetical protein
VKILFSCLDSNSNKSDNPDESWRIFDMPPISDADRQQLMDVHGSLMRLHKILLDDERKAYEMVHGPIEAAGAFLDLVMNDPWFDWLHRLSLLVVKIDEISDSKKAKEASMEDVQNILSQASRLILPGAGSSVVSAAGASDEDVAFNSRYKQVLQRNSAAVLAHAEVLKVIFLKRH